MDRRKNYFIGLDTETCNGIMNGDKLDLASSLVYDIGWAIVDKKGNVYATRSYVVDEIFLGCFDFMKSAYYCAKIPNYIRELAEGTRKIATIYEIREQLKADCEEWNIKAIFAHNARFDVNALNNTIRYKTSSKYRYFLPYGVEIWDTLKMSKVIAEQKMYKAYCEENGYMTNHRTPRPRQTAEILYRYISGEDNFDESHTGLEDVLIETKIFAECFKKHKKMDKLLYPPKAPIFEMQYCDYYEE